MPGLMKYYDARIICKVPFNLNNRRRSRYNLFIFAFMIRKNIPLYDPNL